MSVNFLHKRREQSKVKSLLDHISSGTVTGKYDPDKVVKTIPELDKFIREKLRGDVTIVLAPTGAGKTTFILNDFIHCIRGEIERNRNGCCVIFALEQSVSEIAEKWMKMTDGDPEIAERLFVFSNFDEEESMGLSDMRIKIVEIEETTGFKVVNMTLDHLHLIKTKHIDYNPVMAEIKRMSKDLDVHITVVSQTQKANQIIDVPVPRTGVYNCSQAEWIATNMISIFQPLSRVRSESGLEILGVQYCKIRYKNKRDRIKEGMNYLLSYDADTELLSPLNSEERSKFTMWFEKVLELRQNEEKYKSFQFDLSHTVKGKDGKEVVINSIVGGNKAGDD